MKISVTIEPREWTRKLGALAAKTFVPRVPIRQKLNLAYVRARTSLIKN